MRLSRSWRPYVVAMQSKRRLTILPSPMPLPEFLAHATQLAAGKPISTRTAAMCTPLFLRGLLTALLRPFVFRQRLARGMAFLEANAPRAKPRRDRERGRQSVGLQLRLAA
jgi:hypothetical protein